VATNPLVLVADPDAECAVLMARQLELAGYDVVLASDADDTVALVEQRRPDALVIEATMRSRTGYAVVRELRERPHNRLMPIVMVSARAGKLDRDFAFTVGADDYVKKPFRSADLVARLALLAPSPDAPKPKLEPVPDAAPAAKPSPMARPRRTLAPLALAR
jgi:DNA-binding response OmpR family regulator